jgi:hypothetical protein
MPLPEDFDDSLNEPVIVPHEFEVDLNYLVVSNHRITMEGIDRAENADISELEPSLKVEADYDMISDEIRHRQDIYDGLRRAARNLTMVGLVTRLQHWVALYARRIEPQRKPGKPLEKEFELLEKHLGKGPDDAFFIELKNVRDSVIHADSQATWTHDKTNRQVALRYVVGAHVDLTEEDIDAAIKKAIVQIEWYDKRLLEKHK